MGNYVDSIYKKDNDIFGLPQIYKGIEFHPVKIKEVEIKNKLYMLFFNPKNYIPDKQVLKTSYLKFLLYLIQGALTHSEKDVNVQKELIDFLSYVTKENVEISIEEGVIKSDNIFDKVSVHIMIGGKRFSEQDFDNIREIVVRQNGSSVEYIEEYNPELEQKLSFMNRNSSDIDFKDEVFSFCALTGMSEIQAGEETLYQFKHRFEREMIIKDYNLFKPLEISGQISSKSGNEIFKHYLSHIPEQQRRYGSILIEKNKFLEQSGLGHADNDGNINV